MRKTSTEMYFDLLEALRIINSNHDYGKVLEFIIQMSSKLMHARDSSLLLVDDERKELFVRVAEGSKREFMKTVRFGIDKGIAGWVVRHGKSLVVNDVSTDERFYDRVDRASGFKTESIIAVPLKLNRQTIGVLEVINSRLRQRFTPEQLDLLQAFADQAAIAITNGKRYHQLEQENQLMRKELGERYTLISASESMQSVLETARRAAQTDSTVLLHSESGTGKELIARFIHNNSQRRGRPFVAINCAALSEELLESELFGHEKGAFTGAESLKKGKMERANGGTFFFDEIGELKLSLQSKLLRVLQERIIERIGGLEEITINVRIIAATNRNLKNEMLEGRFREDLYYRINVIPISVPALRDRLQEVEKLAEFFICRYCVKMGRRVKTLSSDALELLKSYHWPGNVRELENIIERAVVLVPDNIITANDLSIDIRRSAGKPRLGVGALHGNYHDAVKMMRKNILKTALEETEWNRLKAAKLLEIQPSYLSKLIKDLEIA